MTVHTRRFALLASLLLILGSWRPPPCVRRSSTLMVTVSRIWWKGSWLTQTAMACGTIWTMMTTATAFPRGTRIATTMHIVQRPNRRVDSVVVYIYRRN